MYAVISYVHCVYCNMLCVPV